MNGQQACLLNCMSTFKVATLRSKVHPATSYYLKTKSSSATFIFKTCCFLTLGKAPALQCPYKVPFFLALPSCPVSLLTPLPAALPLRTLWHGDRAEFICVPLAMSGLFMFQNRQFVSLLDTVSKHLLNKCIPVSLLSSQSEGIS